MLIGTITAALGFFAFAALAVARWVRTRRDRLRLQAISIKVDGWSDRPSVAELERRIEVESYGRHTISRAARPPEVA